MTPVGSAAIHTIKRVRREIGDDPEKIRSRHWKRIGRKTRVGWTSSAATRRRTSASAWLGPAGVHPGQAWRRKLWGLVHGDAKKGYVNCMGALTGGQAVQQAKGGHRAIYLSGLAGGCRRQHLRDHVPLTSRCTPTIQCRRWCAGSTMRSNARTRSSGRAASARVTRGYPRLLPADRGRCRGRFRWRAQRL